MDEVEWMDMEVAAKMQVYACPQSIKFTWWTWQSQVFLYVHKIRKEMIGEGKPVETNDEEEEEDGDCDLEEDFNDIVQQLL